MIYQAVIESEKKRDYHKAEMAEKTVIGTMELCAVEGQRELVRSAVALDILSVAGDVLDEGVVAGHMEKAAMRAVVNPSMIKAVSDALLNNEDIMAPVAKGVSSYV